MHISVGIWGLFVPMLTHEWLIQTDSTDLKTSETGKVFGFTELVVLDRILTDLRCEGDLGIKSFQSTLPELLFYLYFIQRRALQINYFLEFMGAKIKLRPNNILCILSQEMPG